MKSIVKNLSLADLILITVLITLAIGMLIYRRNSPDDAMVLIYKQGRFRGEYPIAIDRIIRIDEHNAVEIKNGKVKMIEADCPDKRCVKQGASSSLPIICLPNELVVEIRNREGNQALIAQ